MARYRELKSAYKAAIDRLAGDTIENASELYNETQWYAHRRLLKSILDNRRAIQSSRFGFNGVIKGTPSFMTLGGGEMFPRNSAAERQAVRINREIHAASAGIAPLNFYPPAVIQKLVSFLPRYRFDDIGKRQKWVKVAATEETGLSLYDPVFAQEQKERYGLSKRGPSRISLDSPDVKMAMALRSAKFAYGHKIEDRDERFRRLMMDDYEGSIYDLMKGGLSRKQANQVYVKQNAKWLSVLANINPKIAKYIPDIAKTLGRVSRIPGLGMAVAHPIAAAGLAGTWAANKIVDKANSANLLIGKTQNQFTLYGKPTKEQMKYGWLALYENPAQIAQAYSKIGMKFGGGNNDLGISILGELVAGMTGVERRKFAEDYGVSADEMTLALLHGGYIKADEARMTAAKRKALEWEEQEGNRTGSGVNETMRSLQLSIPFVKDLFARGISFGELLNAIVNPGYGKLIDKARMTEDAARSADKYDAGGFSQSNDVGESNTTNNKVSFHIGEVKVDANDAQALVDSLMREGGKFTERIRITDSFDSMLYA